MGCQFAQGYHYSRPLPVEQFETSRLDWELRAGARQRLAGDPGTSAR